MRGSWLLVGLVLGLAFAAAAESAAEVRCGTARFTVLTDRLIRMEYAEDGVFEDRPSLVFVNRELPVSEFTLTRSGAGVVLETKSLRLTYRGGKFAPETLGVEVFAATNDHRVAYSWRFGQADDGNLGGTARTLDSCDGFESLAARMGPGLVSRSGVVALDDSATPLLEPAVGPWRTWHGERRPGARQDWYLFAHGHDYRAALADYAKVAGPMRLPPRWLFGYWWCRFWQYSDRELVALADGIVDRGLPLDVVIADMDWHETWGLGIDTRDDEWGQLVGWTGYTWQRHMFPQPERFLADLHARQLKVALNLHPASGISAREAGYRDFCSRLGIAADGRSSGYAAEDTAWAAAWFGAFIEPMERQGVDFWWVDYQQWSEAKGRPGLSNAWWLSHLFGQRAQPPSARPVLYSRWGGLGAHRNQVGFSGDAYASWEVLRMLPHFTATAANVACGYWGHDLGGMSGENSCDEELFVRWFQSAVTQPILKTHGGRDARAERRVWMYPNSEATLRAALKFRYRLAPYLYTAARAATVTGLAMARPFYYDESECEAAYDERSCAYRLGEDIVAVTVGEKIDPATGLATVAFHLPAGDWYDLAMGEVVKGGEQLRGYTLAENPIFLKAGAILPLYPDSVRNLARASDAELELLVAPGAERGATELYEDDGEGAPTATNGAFTAFAWRSSGRRLELELGARRGTYPGAGKVRGYTLRFPNRLAPVRVTLDGRELKAMPRPAAGGWAYDGELPGVVVRTGEIDAGREHRVTLEFAADGAAAGDVRLNGLAGLLRRLGVLGEDLKSEYVEHVSWVGMLSDDFLALSTLASKLEAEPAAVAERLREFDAALAAFEERFAPIAAKLSPGFRSRLRAQLRRGAAVAPDTLPAVARLEGLRTDFAADAVRPAFAWQTAGDAQRRQEAWRVVVTEPGGRMVWDSGVRWSDLAAGIAYAGPALEPGGAYRWQVATCDQYRRWSRSDWAELNVPKAATPLPGFAADAAAMPLGGYVRRERGGLEFDCADAAVAARVRTAIAELVKAGEPAVTGRVAFAAALAEYSMYGDRRRLGAAYAAAKTALAAELARLSELTEDELTAALAESESLIVGACILGELLDEDRLYFRDYIAIMRRLGRVATVVVPRTTATLAAILERWRQPIDTVDSAVRELAGISPGNVRSAPAFKGLELRLPAAAVRGELKAVRSTLKTPYGEVTSAWTEAADGSWDWRLRLPGNVKALVATPDGRHLELYGGEHRFTGR